MMIVLWLVCDYYQNRGGYCNVSVLGKAGLFCYLF